MSETLWNALKVGELAKSYENLSNEVLCMKKCTFCTEDVYKGNGDSIAPFVFCASGEEDCLNIICAKCASDPILVGDGMIRDPETADLKATTCRQCIEKEESEDETMEDEGGEEHA
jgi:hypothetical protein